MMRPPVRISSIELSLLLQVQKVLNPKVGGKADASLEEVVARLSRAKVGFHAAL